MDSQDLWFWALENNDRHNNERHSLCRNSRVDGSWTYPQWALLRKVRYLQLRCNNVGTLHFDQTLGRSTAWTGNITKQEEDSLVTNLYIHITSFCIFLRSFMLLLTRELGLRFLKGHWESLLQVLWLVMCTWIFVWFMEDPYLMCCLLFADCWTEPEQRPSCNEILSRLLDCEYSLC